MKTKAFTAAQIDTLAQRLSETPLEPATSAKKAGDNLARLLAARIGGDRAALAFTSILTAAIFEQAEARLTSVLEYGNTEPAGAPIPAMAEEPKAVTAPVIGKRQTVRDQAQTGAAPRSAVSRNRQRLPAQRDSLSRPWQTAQGPVLSWQSAPPSRWRGKIRQSSFWQHRRR